ncbi:hypothetical protein C1646_95905 [Rhizophagus diaphanus]|nr:hypothetical protein C1646_95905 [Rhizophagus diaphanus] [Rhizophagus sp. MUCL 43196]
MLLSKSLLESEYIDIRYVTQIFIRRLRDMSRILYISRNRSQNPEIDSNFRKYRFKIKKSNFFANTDARQWSFYRYYTSIIHSGDSPKTFNEIFDNWTASLTFIRKHDSTPEPIENFVEKLIKYNKSEEFKSIREACEQNFRAHVLSTLSSGSVTKSEMAQGYKKQANEILSGALEKNDEEVPCTNGFTGEDERNAIIDDIDATISEFSENDLKEFGHKSNEDMNGKIPYQPQDERGATSNSNDDFQKVAESMVGKVERTALIIDDVNLEETFEDYCNECDNIFDLCHSDIMDLRPASKFTEKIPEAIWEKFVTNTYPEYKISETWENLIQDTFKVCCKIWKR